MLNLNSPDLYSSNHPFLSEYGLTNCNSREVVGFKLREPLAKAILIKQDAWHSRVHKEPDSRTLYFGGDRNRLEWRSRLPRVDYGYPCRLKVAHIPAHNCHAMNERSRCD
jgi:hypothetical protein